MSFIIWELGAGTKKTLTVPNSTINEGTLFYTAFALGCDRMSMRKLIHSY